MSYYYRAVSKLVCAKRGYPTVEIDVAYGPLVTEEKRAENLVRAYAAIEPDKVHRLQEVVYDQEGQPRAA